MIAARGCRAYFFDLFRMRGAARQSAATSMAGRLVNCTSAAVQLQKKQSQSLRLDPYVSHREGSIVVLPAANLRGPPDKYGVITRGRPPVRCTPRSGPGVLCSSARFVSAKKATISARGCRAHSFDWFRMRGAARQSTATSMAGFLLNCSSAAVQLQEKQSQRLRLDPYVSHREGSIVVLPAANLRGPPDKYGLITLGRPPVRCTPRSRSGVLCLAARFVSAKKATMAARGCRAYFF